jgi:hypothetical protein
MGALKKYSLQIVMACVMLLAGGAAAKAWAGTTYVFIPQSNNALYSDAANWLNGNYPGNNIPDDDSILFKPGPGFSSAIINIGVTVLGYCRVDSGVTLYVNSGFDLGGLNLFPSFSTNLKTESGSVFIVNGQLTSYARNGVFNGEVIINGNFQARTLDMNDQSGSCDFDFNAPLTIHGSLSFKVSHLSCKQVLVDNTGFIGGSSGYDFWTTSLHIDSLHNSGTVSLREVYFTCTVLQNDSSFSTYTISADSVVNNGKFIISDDLPPGLTNKESSIRRLINEGEFEISYIKLFLGTTFINANDFSIYEGSLMNADVVNEGSFSVAKTPLLQWSSFINNGSFEWTAVDASTEDLLLGSFVNNSSFTHYGKLRVLGGSFTNNGTVTIIPL